MAKRFTDTDKWKKPLLKGIPASYKLLWLYICDDCDHAGIWQVDMQVAGIRIGEEVNEQEAIRIFGAKIIVFDEGEKWFLPGFIEFQYGELNPQNRAHQSVLKILTKYGLVENEEKNKPLTSPLQGAMDMDKDKEQDKVEGGTGETLQLNGRYLAAEMVIQWSCIFPHYPVNQEVDLPAAVGIIKAICKEQRLPHQPNDIETKNRILKRWGEITSHIAQDGFFQKYSLTQVNKHLQSIIQSINATGNGIKNNRRNNADTSKPGSALSPI